MSVTIECVDKVCRSQAASVAAARGSLSLIERGFSRYGHQWDAPAIVGVSDGERDGEAVGECVGILILDHHEASNTVTVALAWCQRDHPSLLARLLLQLRSWCGEKSVTEVFFTCHDDNSDMAKAAAALNAQPWTHSYRVVL